MAASRANAGGGTAAEPFNVGTVHGGPAGDHSPLGSLPPVRTTAVTLAEDHLAAGPLLALQALRLRGGALGVSAAACRSVERR